MTSVDRGLIITDRNGNLLLIDEAMHALTALVHKHLNIETWLMELSATFRHQDLAGWGQGVLAKPDRTHSTRFTMTDGRAMRMTVRPVSVRQLASKLNTFGDAKKQVLTWELESFWMADRTQVIRWIDKMPVGAWIVDLKNQRIQFINTHLRALLGKPDSFWERSMPFLSQWGSFLLEEERAPLMELARRFLASERIEASLSYRIVDGRGERRHLQDHYLKVSDASGKPIELMGISQDITEDIRVRRQLENLLSKQSEVSKLRSDLIHFITHEFKSPIMVIQNSAERVVRQVEGMNQMLSDIAEFAHQGAYKLESGIEMVDVVRLVDEVVQDTPDPGGRTCRVVFKDPEIHILSNAAALKIVMANLLSNAYKYSAGKQSPVIQIVMTPEREWIEFTITDFGIGIPESDRRRIFSPFNRGSNVGMVKGLGVGLSITNELVGMLRGTLDLVEMDSGQTRFFLRIPTNR